MEIVVLVKGVPEAETRLKPNASATDLDSDGVKYVLAGYDESAVEQALLLRESVPGSTVRALAFGPAKPTEEVLRAALSLGVDSGCLIEGPTGGTPTDPIVCARALAYALAKYPHPLVLAGKQASDDESGIVPSAVGELLGVPDFGAVVNLRWSVEKNRLTLQRVLDGVLESIETPLPVVIGLQQAWNDPRTAKLPMILKSRKLPLDRVPWAEVTQALGTHAQALAPPVEFRLPPPRTGARMVDYKTPEEAARSLVRILKEEAKVFP